MKQSHRIITSLAISIITLIAGYIAGNQPFPLGGGPSTVQRFEQARELMMDHCDRIPSEFLAINVAYDRQLVDISDEFGFAMGCTDITDRGKLLWLLKALAGKPYRAIVLDIAFDSTLVSTSDSALYAAIAAMPHTYVAKTSQGGIPATIEHKTRYSEYGTTIEEGNFSKYDFMVHGEESLPLALCRELYGTDLRQAGLLYISGNRIGRRSAAFPLKIRLRNNYTDSAGFGIKNYYNLGADIIGLNVDIASMARDKIVLVGDFCENDMHDTYLGPVSGPAIFINAVDAVRGGALSVSWTAVLALLVIYASVAWCLLSDKGIYDLVPILKRVRSPLVRWAISGMGIGLIFAVVAFCGWLIYGGEPDIIVPTAIFSIIIILHDIRNFKKTI